MGIKAEKGELQWVINGCTEQGAAEVLPLGCAHAASAVASLGFSTPDAAQDKPIGEKSLGAMLVDNVITDDEAESFTQPQVSQVWQTECRDDGTRGGRWSVVEFAA